jgi:nitrous oxidase accessory protein
MASMVKAFLVVALMSSLHAQTPSGMPVTAAGAIEGRPPAAQLSPVQALIDAAAPGATVEVPAGEYDGDLILDRPIQLIGKGRPRLVGSGAGSVVRVRADHVTIAGFDIDGRAGGSMADDAAGIHVAARGVVIRDCHITRSLFGIYLREADGAEVTDSTVDGNRNLEPGDQGSGIHLFNTQGFTLRNNRVHDSRDGFYLQNSAHGIVTHNVASDVRYGLHYMFSDDNVFEDNTFERSAAGAALMYSRRLVFRRNQFVHNRGFASVGLLMQGCDDVLAEDNLIDDNARGVFLEGTHGDVFRRNLIANSDVALVMYDSVEACRFEGNAFVGNLSPLQLNGKRTNTVFSGNYWSDDTTPDLDGDGVRDAPYRLSNIFDHLRGNLTAADLFAQGLAADVLASAERTFPVLEPISVTDARPLARMPDLRDLPVPSRSAESGRAAWLGLATSATGVAAGLAVLFSGRRRSARAKVSS